MGTLELFELKLGKGLGHYDGGCHYSSIDLATGDILGAGSSGGNESVYVSAHIKGSSQHVCFGSSYVDGARGFSSFPSSRPFKLELFIPELGENPQVKFAEGAALRLLTEASQYAKNFEIVHELGTLAVHLDKIDGVSVPFTRLAVMTQV